MIDCNYHNDPARRNEVFLGRFKSTFHLMAANGTVLSGRSPIQLELADGVVRILLRVLLPLSIALIDAISLVKIFLLERGKEGVDHFLLRIVARQVEVDGDGDD